jgi:hypothetical protein
MWAHNNGTDIHPRFKTKNGNVIDLYEQSSAGITTVGDIVTVLQNLGLLS